MNSGATDSDELPLIYRKEKARKHIPNTETALLEYTIFRRSTKTTNLMARNLKSFDKHICNISVPLYPLMSGQSPLTISEPASIFL